MSSSPLRIAIKNLIYTIEDRVLLNIPNLTLEGARITAIMGHNGAGKSLFLRMLHGLLPAPQGCIHYLQDDQHTLPKQAMVFQKPVLLRRSVAANIAFVLKREGLRGKDLTAETEHWLDIAGLSSQAHQPAASLSGGEAQRLAMVRALATRPDVLFLDEATAHLDPSATAAIEGLISLAVTSGTMIVMVTHDRDQARRLSDQVVFLENGTVTETASTSDFFTTPQSPASQNYLAGYLFPLTADQT